MAQATRDAVVGTFTGLDNSASFVTAEGFNLSLSGFGSATVQLQRSFDQGATWLVVDSFTADVEKVVDDPEVGVYYRLEATSHTSGTIAYRMSS